MKRGIFIFALVLSMLNVTAINVITGDSVTGRASSQSTNVSVTVLAIPANITIIHPQNRTYTINSSLILNYSSNGLITWYNLDGSTNYTLSSPTTISVSEGPHTLYIYTNNSDNNVSLSSVEFYVNTTLLTIIYEEYKGAYKGSSTDFDQYSYEELQEMDVSLENTNYGKIQFNEIINVTDDSNFSDKIVDIDSNTNISSNRIELSPSNLPNFNKPSTLWLYSLSYSNPIILKNGVQCTTCVKESYSGGTLKFNVTGFSVYSATETPTPEVPSPPGGGGGGGTVVPPVIEIEYPFPSEIYIRTETITLTIRQGDTEIQTVYLNNKGQKVIHVKVYALNVTEYLIINETDFVLEPNMSKEILIEFLIPEDLMPNIYVGKLVIETEEGVKEIPITINVISKKPYFEVTTRVSPESLEVSPGQEIEGIITINNFQEQGKIPIIVEYGIIDESGNTIVENTENYEIEDFLELKKNIKLPKDISPGNYFFYGKIHYKELSYSSTSWFHVSSGFWRLLFKSSPLPYVVVISIAVGATILYFLFRKKDHKKEKNNHKKRS